MNTRLTIRGMRVWLFALLLAALLLPSVVSFAQGATGTITNVSRLNVRSGPGTGFGVVTILDAGAFVTVLSRNADSSWVQIQLAGGAQGWVNARYIALSVPIGSLPVTAQGTGASGSVVAFFLNVRSGPGVVFPVVGVLSSRDGVNLIGRNADGSWVEIVLPAGTRGWVNRHWLRINIDVNALPITDGSGGGGVIPGPNGTVTAFYLNVRYGPAVTFGAFTRLTRNQVVSLVGRTAAGNWVQIQIPGGAVGWVNANYLRPSVPISSLPVTG